MTSEFLETSCHKVSDIFLGKIDDETTNKALSNFS